MGAQILSLPLFLQLFGLSALSMFVPALHAAVSGSSSDGRAYLYVAFLGLLLTLLIAITLSSRPRKRKGGLGNLLALFAAFTVLPVFLALPFYEAVQNTSFANAYFEMVSSLTTTGATMFGAEGRLAETQHLWRAQVGWMGGLLIWVAAAAVLAPLNLGGFEVTATAEPGQGDVGLNRFEKADENRRVLKTLFQLLPIYAGLTGVLWLMLLIGGDAPFVALCHAMSTMATSGISPIGGIQNSEAGIPGEMVVFLFMLFALSRLTFSSDTLTTAREGLHNDPEFRIGMLFVLGVPFLLFARHWLAALEVDEVFNSTAGLRALWGSMFTVLSFLSTTGFESADWSTAREWSGLGTPGFILMGLALMGGGVATTAGGVKLLRVYALYLNGLREMERLVHPSSIGRARAHSRRIRKQGAFIAWIFFMLFALSLALVSVALAALGQEFDDAILLSVAALSTTGPLITVASEASIPLLELSDGAKAVLTAAMVLGRLETLAIIALFNPDLWRD